MFPRYCQYDFETGAEKHTPMNSAIALPLVTGSSYISANIPPVTEIGLLAFMPTNILKIKRAGKFGESAHAMVKMVKKRNDPIMIDLLPYDSESGPKSKGPSTYPKRYIDIGRI
jgi:hypothetical protein